MNLGCFFGCIQLQMWTLIKMRQFSHDCASTLWALWSCRLNSSSLLLPPLILLTLLFLPLKKLLLSSILADKVSALSRVQNYRLSSCHLNKQTDKAQIRHPSASPHQRPQPVKYFLIPVPSFASLAFPRPREDKVLSPYSTFWQGFPGE